MSEDPRLAKYAAMNAEQLDDAIAELGQEMCQFNSIIGDAATAAMLRIVDEVKLAHSCYTPEALKAREHLLKD
ncbi:MAG: hypothetical protein ING75_17420 [Rhodocyclaceae bacterium]|nr:hypothetical protein [Rhodocyclaceae bacterium]